MNCTLLRDKLEMKDKYTVEFIEESGSLLAP